MVISVDQGKGQRGRAIGEVWRVLRPGRLLLEHTAVRLVLRFRDPFFCLLAGDHQLRDPLPIVLGLGFDVVTVERQALGLLQRLHDRRDSVDPDRPS